MNTLDTDGYAHVPLNAHQLRSIAEVMSGRREPNDYERDVIGNAFMLAAVNAGREVAARAEAAQWVGVADAAAWLGITIDTLRTTGIVTSDGRVHRVDLDQYHRETTWRS